MLNSLYSGNRLRVDFSNVAKEIDVPNLLQLQKKSFDQFLNVDKNQGESGIEKVFKSIFPIHDPQNRLSLEYVSSEIGKPKYTIRECMERGLTYSVNLKMKVRLIVHERDEKTGEKIGIKDIKEQEIFVREIPLMTDRISFIINGVERVVVNQLHRSPGVIFKEEESPTVVNKLIYTAQIIPDRGSWLYFEYDTKDVLYVRINKRRKVPVTILFRALGYKKQDIIKLFYPIQTLTIKNNKFLTPFSPDDYQGRVEYDIKDEEGNVLHEAGKRLTKKKADKIIADGVKFVEYPTEILVNRFLAHPVIDKNSGEVLYDTLAQLDENKLVKILADQESIEIANDLAAGVDDAIINSFIADNETLKLLRQTENVDDENDLAAIRIYKVMRPGEPVVKDAARAFVNDLFFNPERYDLTGVGRMKMNHKLALEVPEYVTVLTNEDIIKTAKYLIKVKNGQGHIDDRDHLGNRRIRSIGELLANELHLGFVKMQKAIRDKFTTLGNTEEIMPYDLVNPKMITTTIMEFFTGGQLSQFMDQTNPLAEVTHKRRLSALGPGGLSRERAGFEVRDVHYTHYGRLCPIESPEGPNIGLISSLCMYAKINDLGFIVTPYRRVTDSKVDMDNKDVLFLTAEEEEEQIIGQGNAPLNDDGTFIRDTVKCRQDADYPVVGPESVDLIDVSPQQIASVSAGLIPFLEHDDGHRALMGCNMMRQAVPLLHNDAPIVGTGLEKQVCEDSRTMITAEGDGVIEYVDATTIRILYDRSEDEEFVSFEPALKEYRIPKFRRTNQNMVVDLRPICDKGQRVKKGDILTEGYATENGELALGRNLLVAYMPWKGYNYEDAVVISERMVREDVLTSVHVDEYSLEVRETKRGVEEFTSDIPNVSEEATKDLDDNGIIRVGARVEPGDIMIGKISPKGESDPSPEEKLLRAIFGDKAGDVKDSSLKANPSLSGVVIDKKLFSRAIKTRESKRQDKVTLAKIDEEQEAKINDLKDLLVDKLLELTEDKVSQGVKDYSDAEIITKGSKFSVAALKNLDYEGIQSNGWTDDEHTNLLIQKLIMNYIRKFKQMDAELKRKKFAITIGDELPSGVLQMAKVYIAKKRKIQVGDKLAGRHGNKGIVSKVVRTEDMPFLEDGRPVDLVLNPMGVPSRMNLGQIFEAILGAAGRKLGVKFATPIFDGAKLSDLKEWTDKAGLPNLCSTYIYDGETGEKFDQPATVGITYFLKLGHMVEDKMHARSIGPYSLITQQPLGGKAQFGGQRFGEMEVWAIEAFGASHVLQEILTIKSDDVVGRSKAYEAIVKGEPMPTPGIPESLNVLLHELRGLGLSIKLD